MSEFQFTDARGKLATGRKGFASHLSRTWKWGVLINDSGDIALFKTQSHAVIYAHYMWGSHANFVLVRYCAQGSKS